MPTPTARSGSGTRAPVSSTARSCEARPQASANAVAFSPDGKLLATGYGNGTIRLWDPAAGQPEGSPLQTGPSGVNALAFSPDGKLLATAYGNGTVRLWDPAAGQSRGPALGADSQASANAVAFSPDGKLLATAYGNGTIRLWDPAACEPVGAPLQTGPEGVNALAFSPTASCSPPPTATPSGYVRAAGHPAGPDNVSWPAILAFAIAIAVSALAVIATVRGIRRLKKASQ